MKLEERFRQHVNVASWEHISVLKTSQSSLISSPLNSPPRGQKLHPLEKHKHIIISYSLPFSASVSPSLPPSLCLSPSLSPLSLSLSLSVINFLTSSFWSGYAEYQNTGYASQCSQFHSSSSSSSSSNSSSSSREERTTRSAVKMSAGDVVCTGWLIKSPRRRSWRDLWVGVHTGRLFMSSGQQWECQVMLLLSLVCVCVYEYVNTCVFMLVSVCDVDDDLKKMPWVCVLFFFFFFVKLSCHSVSLHIIFLIFYNKRLVLSVFSWPVDALGSCDNMCVTLSIMCVFNNFTQAWDPLPEQVCTRATYRPQCFVVVGVMW